MVQKVIGILGGMGPQATLYLFEKIIRNTPAKCDQDHLRVIIDNNPKVPDRTRAILENGENPVPLMVKGAQTLIQAGADFILIPCISAHYFLDELNRKLSRPILSAFDAVAKQIVGDHPDIKTVGLLATNGTIQGGCFQKRLTESGIQTQIPGEPYQRHIISAIYGIKGDPTGLARTENKTAIKLVAEHLIQNGCQGIIAGCTEIPLVLSPKDIDVPLFNPLLILAEAAIQEAKQVVPSCGGSPV
tara:strand:+ start:57 stop:791 length:735 start_codon:yes stop_codon:yes gene_type:complete